MANTDHYNQPDEEDGQETPLGDVGHLVSASEINQQIATAKRYPRSITKFIKDAEGLVSLNESVASQCTYILTRSGKTIEGPSARFAEIINGTYKNIRSAARVVDIGDEFITAEGICYDLENNNAIRYEVMRRITDREGRRYNADMIGVTGNAACSIALRNAILKVVPKAFWSDIWDLAKTVARGDEKTFTSRRNNVLETFKKMGVAPQQIYDLLGIGGLDDLTRDHMVILAGILTAIKDGDTTVEAAFNQERQRGQVTVISPGRKNEFERAQQAQPSTAPQKAQEAAQSQPTPQAEQKPAAAPAKQEAPQEAVQAKAEERPAQQQVAAEQSAPPAQGTALADWLRDLKGLITNATKVSACNEVLTDALDELGPDHPAYLELAQMSEKRSREILAAKGAKKGR